MKVSTSILSKSLGLPLMKVLTILGLLAQTGLITRTVSKEGTQIELTEKAQILLSSTSQTLCRESQHTLRQYYAHSLQILHIIKLSS